MADAREKLAASYAEIDADAARIRQNSAEFLWICCGIVPPKLPDAVSSTAELNPQRRTEKVSADAAVSGMRETRLDYSVARPPVNGQGR
jgi:hypothetical protein